MPRFCQVDDDCVPALFEEQERQEKMDLIAETFTLLNEPVSNELRKRIRTDSGGAEDKQLSQAHKSLRLIDIVLQFARVVGPVGEFLKRIFGLFPQMLTQQGTLDLAKIEFKHLKEFLDVLGVTIDKVPR